VEIGAFRLEDPVPETKGSILLLALQPWIDVGGVGTTALSFLEETWQARPLGYLTRPGHFYDFTRYRPMLHREGERRIVTLPNTYIRYAQDPGGGHWIFVHALEPHAHGEEFLESLVGVMEKLAVQCYGLIGSYYGPVPHTRPPILTGGATSPIWRERLKSAGVRESRYEGPTTILALLMEYAQAIGVEVISVLVQVPAYAQMERDYRGTWALLMALSRLFTLPLDLEGIRQEGEKQYAEIDSQARRDPRLQRWIEELERIYDAEAAQTEQAPKLSPELERFLEELERRWEGPSQA